MSVIQPAERLVEAVGEVLPEALDLSHRVHATPEIAFEEHRAAGWTADLLARHRFDVTRPAGGLETALVARWKGATDGPVIAFEGEYDALPEVGYGCGHNLMCSSSAGAAVAATRVLGREFAGEIRFIGTPAEEAGNGKVRLIGAGAFDDVDERLKVMAEAAAAATGCTVELTTR